MLEKCVGFLDCTKIRMERPGGFKCNEKGMILRSQTHTVINLPEDNHYCANIFFVGALSW